MLLHTIVLLFCYKNNSVDYHWDACYFAIYAILLFRGLPGTGTLAILLLCYFAILWFTTGTLAILLFMLFCYSVTTTGTLAILLFMLFCYSVIITTGTLAILLFCDYHWVTCYFAIYAILLFHGLPGTGTLAILLLILCMLVILLFCGVPRGRLLFCYLC